MALVTVREALRDFGTCKPCSWAEIPMLEGELKIEQASVALKQKSVLDVYGMHEASPSADFSAEQPLYFILMRGKARFLVGTESYNYARYMVRLA